MDFAGGKILPVILGPKRVLLAGINLNRGGHVCGRVRVSGKVAGDSVGEIDARGNNDGPVASECGTLGSMHG